MSCSSSNACLAQTLQRCTIVCNRWWMLQLLSRLDSTAAVNQCMEALAHGDLQLPAGSAHSISDALLPLYIPGEATAARRLWLADILIALLQRAQVRCALLQTLSGMRGRHFIPAHPQGNIVSCNASSSPCIACPAAWHTLTEIPLGCKAAAPLTFPSPV